MLFLFELTLLIDNKEKLFRKIYFFNFTEEILISYDDNLNSFESQSDIITKKLDRARVCYDYEYYKTRFFLCGKL